MIRVAFTIPSFDEKVWMGGLNYFRNLISAVLEQPDRRIQPVLFADPSEGRDRFAASLPGIEVAARHDVPSGVLARVRSKLSRTFVRRAESVDEAWLRKLEDCGIGLLSHSEPLPPGARLRSLSWIPDFQHKRLPEFFSADEREARDCQHRRYVEHSDAIVVSSETARRDFDSFYPAARGKAHVLRFVAGIPSVALSETEVREKYSLLEPYFALPNQFWKHKNHGLVIEALDRLQRRGERFRVVCTGSTSDYRHPDYFDELTMRVKSLGLVDSFRILGIVPAEDLAGLIRHSVALINPSYFEGWSTSVEEAKTLGKLALLSDLAVHREQSPDRSTFFHPDDADALAEAMMLALEGYEPMREAQEMDQARARGKARRRRFAIDYQSIVESVCGLGLSLGRASDGT